MIIQALNKNFDVIHIIEEKEEYRVLQCRDFEGKVDYTMLHFRREEIIKRLLPSFYSLQENAVYEDYFGCFSKEEGLYVVFYKRQGVPLKKLLSDKFLSLEQRILIGKRILEKFLLWKLPDFLICQLLDVNRILIRNEEVEFSYDWDLSITGQPDMTVVSQRMKEFLQNLFSKEIEYAVSPKLINLLTYLEENLPEDFFAIYEAYSSLYDVLPREAEEYVSGFGKIKKRIRAFFNKGCECMKVILFLALYIAGILLIVNEIKNQNDKKEEPDGIIYETIGTLKIK